MKVVYLICWLNFNNCFRNMNPSDDAAVDDKALLWIYVNKIEKIAEGRSWRFEYKF